MEADFSEGKRLQELAKELREKARAIPESKRYVTVGKYLMYAEANRLESQAAIANYDSLIACYKRILSEYGDVGLADDGSSLRIDK